LGLREKGKGFRVYGLGVRVQGSGLRVKWVPVRGTGARDVVNVTPPSVYLTCQGVL